MFVALALDALALALHSVALLTYLVFLHLFISISLGAATDQWSTVSELVAILQVKQHGPTPIYK